MEKANTRKRVCVTGGCGFIGSNLVSELVRQGYKVDIFDDMSNGRFEFLIVEPIDVNNSNDTVIKHVNLIFCKEEALKNVQYGLYDYVFHLAANPRPALSIESPLTSYNDNVHLSLEFLEACRKCLKSGHNKDIKFIFASSSAVYGECQTCQVDHNGLVSMTESDDLNPVSPYGLEKKNVEEMMAMYNRVYRLNSVALRYFNVYGKNQLASPKYPCVVAAWMKALLKGTQVKMNGGGLVRRDFVHVDDVVEATITAATVGGNGFEVFNVGSGKHHSLDDLRCHLENVTGKKLLCDVTSDLRPGDVASTLANTDQLKNELGIKPVSLVEGLKRTYTWAEDSWVFKNLSIKI